MRVSPGVSRRLARAGGLALVTGLLAIVLHQPLLRAAGRALVWQDDLVPADAVVVPTWAGLGAALDVIDVVVTRRLTGHVVIIVPPSTATEREFVRRGYPYDDSATRMIRILERAGIATDSIELLPVPVGGTSDEVGRLARWCREGKHEAIIVLTPLDHGRRLKRTLQREESSVRMIVRPISRNVFNPEDWWTGRDGLRIGIVELQKLALDVVLHPVSW